MRIIANYLPQFHRIPENDAWWGEGFTEWTTVRNAKPLFEGHDQPRIPLNNNYYDLIEKKTMEWQADLMHQYGIDGFAMYHYWFKDGKRVLEKPAENLLQWKDIDMPFCFCWANETWARTWADAGRWVKNAWANVLEPDKSVDYAVDSSGILLEQQYGTFDDWKYHFEYLLPFFCDERYIRIDDKPVMIIYRATEIDCLGDMIACWRKLAVQNGLKGLYIMGGGMDRDISDCIDGYYHRAPADLRNLFARFPGRDGNAIPIPYNEVWKAILDCLPTCDSQPYFSGVVSYDTTPRQGKKGTIYEGVSPEIFEKCLYRLLIKNHLYGSDITFVNAWNEWGEGMYLEPDSKWKYSFLEAVKNAKLKYMQYDSVYSDENASREVTLLRKMYVTQFDKCRRADSNVALLERWMSLYEKDIDIMDCFENMSAERVAVYGYGILGRRLVRLLRDRGIRIGCVIDKNANALVLKDDELPGCRIVSDIKEAINIDIAIVAVSGNCDNVRYELQKAGIGTVFTIMEIIETAEREIE